MVAGAVKVVMSFVDTEQGKKQSEEGFSMRQEITVKYAAPGEVADSLEVAEHVRQQIERHVLTIEQVAVIRLTLLVQITRFEFNAAKGTVGMALEGSADEKPIEASFLSIATRQKLFLNRYRGGRGRARKWRQRQRNSLSVAIVVRFMDLLRSVRRVIFPSMIASAIGRPWSNGRALLALEDCLADIYVAIDKAVERPDSGGTAQYRTALRTTVGSAAVTVPAAIAFGAFSTARGGDAISNFVSAMCVGLGLSGFIYGWCLVSLPRQFYMSEAAGRKIMSLSGRKSSAGVRVLGGCLCLMALLFIVMGFSL
jgi:hypothetical protein